MALSRQKGPGAVPAIWQALAWKQFRVRVFKLLELAYRRMDVARYPDADEDVITGELTRALGEVLGDPRSPRWVDRYYVCEEPRLHDAARQGKRRHRVDIRFECSDQRPRAHYEFEAKRLKRGRSACRRYLGADGLGAFLIGRYASGWPEAGMLAYLQSDDVSYWVRELAASMVEDAGSGMSAGLESVQTNTELWTCVSRHMRTPPCGEITVYHVFLWSEVSAFR